MAVESVASKPLPDLIEQYKPEHLILSAFESADPNVTSEDDQLKPFEYSP